MELSVFEHGSHVFFVSKWMCDLLETSFTPEIALGALLHDAGKLEKEVDEINGKWEHSPYSDEWIDKILEDKRFDDLRELLEQHMEEDLEEVDLNKVRSIAKSHHTVQDVALFASEPSLYIPLVADGLASVLEKGFRGKVETLIGTAEGRVRGFTEDKVNNLRNINEGEKVDELLEEEIHSLELPGEHAGDIFASSSIFKVMEDELVDDLIYQEGAALILNTTEDELSDLLKEEDGSKKIHFQEPIDAVLGDAFVKAVVGEIDERSVPFARSKEEAGQYRPHMATNWGPSSLKPLLGYPKIVNTFAAKYLRHTEYEPSFTSLDIDVKSWAEKIRENGLEEVKKLYEEVKETIWEEDEDVELPPDLEDVNQWAKDNYGTSKWKPTGKGEEYFGDTFDKYPCLKYFTDYYHKTRSALTLYKYHERAKSNQDFYLEIEDIASIDGSRISEDSGEECSICMERPANVKSSGIISPEPQTPSRWRLGKGDRGLTSRPGQIKICKWCYFVGLVSMPFKTIIEVEQALSHSEDLVYLRAPITKKRMEKILDFLKSHKKDLEEDSSEEKKVELSEEVASLLEGKGRDTRPIVDMVDSFYEMPKGYIVEPLKSLDTMMGLKVFFGDLKGDIDESYHIYPVVATIHSMIESGAVLPVEIIHGDPQHTQVRGKKSELKESRERIPINQKLTEGENLSLSEEEIDEFESSFDPSYYKNYDPKVILEGERVDFNYLRRGAKAFWAIKKYGWYKSGRKRSWDFANEYMDDPRIVSDLLFNRMREGEKKEGYPNAVGNAKTMELVYMNEEASEGMSDEKEFIRNSGLWMTKFLIDTGLVPEARSLIEKSDEGFGTRSHEFTAPIHSAAVSGDIRSWVDSMENRSRRIVKGNKSWAWRDRPLNKEEVYKLTAFAEAFQKECDEKNLLMENALSEIDSMAQHLHFSIAHNIASEEEIEEFYEELLSKHGFETEVEEYEEE